MGGGLSKIPKVILKELLTKQRNIKITKILGQMNICWNEIIQQGTLL